MVRAGAGFNTIDVAAASRRGIYVSNCPGKNSVAVAELAFGLILSLDRRIPDNVAALRAGKWNKGEFSKARGLFGRTLGLIGLGQIGREMVPRAHAFGMNVIAWSRSLTPESATELGVGFKATATDVAASADIVSVHVALNAKTRNMLGKDFFDAMRKGAYFVNTARAEVIDQNALLAAVREKGIKPALDVYSNEPSGSTGEFSDPIAQEVYGTHHIGASTDQAQEAIAMETVRIIASFMGRGEVPNAVNLAKSRPPPARWWSAIWIGPACWPACSIRSARRPSTFRRWRISCSKARRPRWRASIWRRSPPRRCWTKFAAATRISSN